MAYVHLDKSIKSYYNRIVMAKKEKTLQKVRVPISVKLITIISMLVIFSLGTVTALVTYFVREDVQLTAEQNNHTINTQTADIAETEIGNMRDNAFLLIEALSFMEFDSEDAIEYTKNYFDRNKSIVAVSIPQYENFVNEDFFFTNELDDETYSAFIEAITRSLERSKSGEVIVLNATPFLNVPTMAILQPFSTDEGNNSLVVVFSIAKLTETFASGSTNASYMINDSNDILIHADIDVVNANTNMSNVELVKQMRKNNDKNRQVIFKDSNGEEFFGAYTKLSIGDVGVITTIQSSLVFEGVNATVLQNIYLACAVLFFTIMFIWFFSKSISRPVKVLTHASAQIEAGNFDVKLKPRTKDEVGLLTTRFMSMAKGLETFGRFVNLDIALRAMKGDLQLGGETKYATIFFSDIRSFTAISEKLEPEEVVEFLNDYMTRMVKCVKDTNGTVDKFIGDAVMAVWGASSSAGTPQLDAINGVRAALMMRAALIDFNKDRGEDKKPIIKIGCGLNTGPVVAGQMGSFDRMEYTVIGDAVNFASRTETLTKPFSADILITEDTYEYVKDFVIVEKMPSVTVKGKEAPVSIYAVINMPYANDIEGAGPNGPKTMEELRSLLGMINPDLTNVDADAEEQKYKIGEPT